MRQIKSQKLLMLRFILVFLVLNGNLCCKPGLFETNSVEGVVIKVSNHPFLDFMLEFFDIFPLRLFFTFTFSIIVFLEDSQRIIVVITVKLFFEIMASGILDEIEIFCLTFDILLELFVNLSLFITSNLQSQKCNNELPSS